MTGPSQAPKLSKWPFLLGDCLLAGLAAVIVLRSPAPLNVWHGALCLIATIAGAFFCAWPFVREHQAALRLCEADALASTVAQIENLAEIKNHITGATAQWSAVRDESNQTVAAAREISERMKAQLNEFCAFLQRAHDEERERTRLELEKLRRGEREWLQAAVLMLDHVFAVSLAGARSGQPALAAQLSQFQMACRDAVRRLGLVPFAPGPNDAFDPKAHQLENPDAEPQNSARVSEILALGYTLRGEMVRRALVRVQPAGA